jgi:PEP-CTERM motif
MNRTWVLLAGVASALSLTAMAGAAQAGVNLISDGDFSTPAQGDGFTIYSPGINGWVNDNGDGVEIGNSSLYGLACDNAACQNLEVNANTFDTDSQTISGLTVGKTYDLSFDYGGRTSGGPDALDVSFGGKLLTQDSGSVGAWTPNSFLVTATSTSETLEFASLNQGGLPSFGNEITNVVLAAVPEPAAWAMLLVGVGMIGGGLRIARRRSAIALAA